MTFTFQNVWENRFEFLQICRITNIEFWDTICKQLIEAISEASFLKVILDEFSLINKHIKEFQPKFDNVWDFSAGIALVKLNEKYGYIKEDGSFLAEPKFDRAFDFDANSETAIFKINEKYGYLKLNGLYLTEPRFDYAGNFSNGYARVKLNGIYYKLDKEGNLSGDDVF